MRARFPFEAAIVRLVPRVDREEFVNIGAVLFCQPLRFLEMRVEPDWTRLQAFAPGALDRPELEAHLAHLVRIAAADKSAGPLAELSAQERFHWLVSPRSTVIQISAPHAGLCASPAEELEHLLNSFVRWHE